MLQGFGSGCTGDNGGEGSVHVEMEFVPFSACSFFPASLLHRGAWGRDLTQDHDMRPLNLPRSLSDRPHSTARVSITPLLVSLGFRWQNLSQAPRDRRDAWNTWTRGTRGTPSAPFCSHIPRQDPKSPSLLQHPVLPPTPDFPAGSCWPISTACPATVPCTCWCLDREFWGVPGFGWVLEVGPCPVPSYLALSWQQGMQSPPRGGHTPAGHPRGWPQGSVAHCPPSSSLCPPGTL